MDFTLLTHATALASLAVVLIHQILKWQYFPVSFANKYPVPTLLALSVGAAIVVVWRGGVQVHSWTDFVLEASTVAVVAALTYITTIKNWTALRASEGAK